MFHLPVMATGDGGLHTTAADVRMFWEALFADRIISTATRMAMLRPRQDVPEEEMRYGLGVWLHETRDVAILVGSDAGVSFRSVHDPAAGLTHTDDRQYLVRRVEGDLRARCRPRPRLGGPRLTPVITKLLCFDGSEKVHRRADRLLVKQIDKQDPCWQRPGAVLSERCGRTTETATDVHDHIE